MFCFEMLNEGLEQLGTWPWWCHWRGGIYCRAQSRHCLWLVLDWQICGGHRRNTKREQDKNRWIGCSPSLLRNLLGVCVASWRANKNNNVAKFTQCECVFFHRWAGIESKTIGGLCIWWLFWLAGLDRSWLKDTVNGDMLAEDKLQHDGSWKSGYRLQHIAGL